MRHVVIRNFSRSTAMLLTIAAFSPIALAQPVAPLPTATPTAEDIIALQEDAATRMTVSVRLGGTTTRNFLVDTGADRTVISTESAQQLQLAEASLVRIHTMNGTEKVSTVIIPELGVANTRIANIKAPALAASYIGADGVLGIDSLKNKRILIDFLAKKLTIAESSEIEKRDEPDMIVITAKSRFGQLILVDADIDGRKIHVILDTGAQNSVGNSALRALTAKGSSQKPPVVISLMGVTGAKTNADYSQIDKIRIGGFNIKHVPIAFADVHPFKRFGLSRRPALLLGMDVLRKFDRVSIDFANRKIKFLLPRDS